MSQCKICQNETQSIIDFGRMPIANGFIKSPDVKEYFYDMSVVFCPKCFMVQLADTVKPEAMFNDHYQFVSSSSDAMAEHFKSIADEVSLSVQKRQNAFVVELGCNDGIMLKHLAQRGIKHLGIEPSSNVAQMARDNHVNVFDKFFNKQAANDIVRDNGQADVICGSNVFCHIEDINSVFDGINVLLKDNGILFFEDPYLLDIVKKSSFDQIYDEHVFYYSGLSVSELAKRHGLQLIDMKPQSVHGGSMRYYLNKGSHHLAAQGVERLIHEERSFNLHSIEGYVKFKENVNRICDQLKDTLDHIKGEGHRIAGYGATSKSTTLLNYMGLGPDTIEYISDTTPTKIDKFTPGTHIPIKSYSDFLKDNLNYVLLLAWNHKKEIFNKEESFRARGGKFITYFPEVTVE